jgi:signal transduction histidine kinase
VLHDLRAERVAAQVRISLERRLRDAQRLESLGVLAGGIAHDFNNILTAIMGNVELAILEPDLEPATRAGLEQAFKGAQRAAELTRQLLAFAGRGQFLMHPLDLNTLVLELCDSMQRTPSIAVELDLAPDLPAVEADEAQLRQLIASLLANAVEALEPQHRAGQLLVRTRAVSLSRPELQALGLPESLAPHLFVQLRVEDNGHGMDRATLARIFDPFFSTRFLGRGLGLAAARGIVRAHQGALQVLSEPGLGTNVLVWLPIAPQPTPQTRPGRTGSVLVVGAQSATWEGFVQQLTPLGFTPIFLDTTTEALARISAGLPDLAAALLVEELPPVERTRLADAMGALHPGAILLSLGGIVGTQDTQIAAAIQALLRLEP